MDRVRLRTDRADPVASDLGHGVEVALRRAEFGIVQREIRQRREGHIDFRQTV
jgi:hypothetical protein